MLGHIVEAIEQEGELIVYIGINADREVSSLNTLQTANQLANRTLHISVQQHREIFFRCREYRLQRRCGSGGDPRLSSNGLVGENENKKLQLEIEVLKQTKKTSMVTIRGKKPVLNESFDKYTLIDDIIEVIDIAEPTKEELDNE